MSFNALGVTGAYELLHLNVAEVYDFGSGVTEWGSLQSTGTTDTSHCPAVFFPHEEEEIHVVWKLIAVGCPEEDPGRAVATSSLYQTCT